MTLIGMAYVKGYDIVRMKSPEHLPHFYLIMATIRILLVLTVVGLYVLFADSREDIIRFGVMTMVMYAIMMVVTLLMRH
jgi:cytochrome c biogenesis factor